MSLSDTKQDDIIDAFNTTSRHLDDVININDLYFDNMVSQIYPPELQLNKANTSDTEEGKVAKFRNRYNQVPHLTRETPRVSDKNTIKDHKREPRGQPFPSK